MFVTNDQEIRWRRAMMEFTDEFGDEFEAVFTELRHGRVPRWTHDMNVAEGHEMCVVLDALEFVTKTMRNLATDNSVTFDTE